MKRATLLYSALLLAPAMLSASAPPPPVRLKLSDEIVVSGDREKVKVRSEFDGYLVVLRMDADGYVRVIFPVDPDDDAYIRRGHDFEVRSRGNREAFVVNESRGSGLVMAAVSDRPFNFDAFSRGNHWDYRAMAPANGNRDPEAAMLDIVDHLTDGRYNYDLVSYTIGRRPMYGPVYAGWYGPWYPSRYGVWIGGRPYHYYAPRIGFGIRFGTVYDRRIVVRDNRHYDRRDNRRDDRRNDRRR